MQCGWSESRNLDLTSGSLTKLSCDYGQMTVMSPVFTFLVSLNLFTGDIAQILIFFLLSNDYVKVSLDEMVVMSKNCSSQWGLSFHSFSWGHLVMFLRHFWLSQLEDSATDIQWVKARDAVKYPIMHKNKTAPHPQQWKCIWSKISIVPKLRNPALKVSHGFLACWWKATDYFYWITVKVMFPGFLFPQTHCKTFKSELTF